MSPPKTQRRGQRGKAGAGSTTSSGSSSESSSKAGPNKTTLTKQSSTSSSSSSTSSSTTTAAPSAREQPGRWNEEEHMLFLQGLQLYGKSWKKISTIVKTRTVVQIRTHAQKYLIKMEKAKKYGLTGVIMMDGKAIKRQAMEEAAAKCAGSGNKATRTRRRRRREEDESTDDDDEEDERESSMDEGDEEEYDVDDEHTSYGSEEDRVILTRPRRRNRTRRLIKDEHPTYDTDAHTRARSTHTHSGSSTPSSTTTTIVGYQTSSELHTISPAFCPSTIPTDPLPLLDLPLDLLCDDADFLSNDTASCGGSDVSASTSSPSTLSCCSPYNSPLLTHSDVETHCHTHTATHTHTMDAFVLPSAAEGGVCVSHSQSACVQPHTQQAHTQTQHTSQVVVGGCACARGEEKGVCKGACVSGCGMVGGEGGADCVSNTPCVRVQSPIQMIMAQQGYPPHTTHAATSPTLPFHDAHTHTHTANPHTQTHTHILPTTPISSLLLNDEHDALSASLLDFDVDVWMMDGVLLEDVCV